jgi:hypothetical protein
MIACNMDDTAHVIACNMDATAYLAKLIADSREEGRKEAIKGAVNGWAVVRADGSTRAAYSVGEVALRDIIPLSGETIRPASSSGKTP